MELEDKQLYYSLGKRDCLAEVLMVVRISIEKNLGVNAALLELADSLLAADPDHPHAKWIKEHFKVRRWHKDPC